MRNKSSLNRSNSKESPDGPIDEVDLSSSMVQDIIQSHRMICNCDKLDQCVHIFRRCVIDRKMYHSLIYSRRNSTISYFVQYYEKQEDCKFGKIRYFFTSNDKTFAVIDHYKVKNNFSEFFISTPYYKLLRKSINTFFHVLSSHSSSVNCVPVALIRNHCIIFEMTNYIIVTPLSAYDEHD